MRRSWGLTLLVAALVVGAVLALSAPLWASRIARVRTAETLDHYEAPAQAMDAATADLRSRGHSDARCAATVLRVKDSTVWAMTHCAWGTAGAGAHRSELVSPVRVDGTKVIWPPDREAFGAAFADHIRANYPWDVAQLVLSQPRDLVPALD